MDSILQTVLTILCSVLASSGFWALLQRYLDKNDNSKKLLLGIAHDRLMWLGSQYKARGTMTADEYENYLYLYEPYRAAGGNGSVERIKREIDDKVEIVSNSK